MPVQRSRAPGDEARTLIDAPQPAGAATTPDAAMEDFVAPFRPGVRRLEYAPRIDKRGSPNETKTRPVSLAVFDWPPSSDDIVAEWMDADNRPGWFDALHDSATMVPSRDQGPARLAAPSPKSLTARSALRRRSGCPASGRHRRCLFA